MSCKPAHMIKKMEI